MLPQCYFVRNKSHAQQANFQLFTLLQEWNHHINGATHGRRCQLLLEMYELDVQ